MNNLLRTLTSSQLQSSPDLKLLLSSVKDVRRQGHDSKLSDPFYDSLEGLLVDVRTVTMDNHDAEAFLKPVSKSDVPDYYDVISTPMDLQTMLKKVKQKSYKSKREFKDDLDLIWSNCFTYNATENHPLRQCAKRLKIKAEKLLKSITDRKERTDPPIPSGLLPLSSSSHKGKNGISKQRSASTSSSTKRSSQSPDKQTPGPSWRGKRRKFRLDAPFPETPAIVRDADGMNVFAALDRDLGIGIGDGEAGPSNWERKLEERLREYAASAVHEDVDSESEEGGGGVDDSPMSVDSHVGDKRKLSDSTEQGRPRKRSRVAQPMIEDKDMVELWWDAVRSGDLLGNGLPHIRYTSSLALDPHVSPQSKKTPKANKRKKRARSKAKASKGSLLGIMNNNIRTMKRVRSTHAKFAALNQNQERNEDSGESPEPVSGGGGGIPEAIVEEGEEEIMVDERPWKSPGKGIEIGEAQAEDCLGWMGGKVLEHSGFQGTAKSALDVLAGVTSEYLFNVGKTIKLVSEKFSNKMTAEEIILHTLFESGTTKIQDLERYIKDDVVRYGSRLGDLEKKLVSAYREATTVEALDDDALFGNEEEEEEDGAFVMGGGSFADAFGEDFLGLRELGIAEELGMSSLTIPKKLLKGKNKGQSKTSSAVAQSKEPPLPYPPPPAFVLLDSKNVDHQIGILKPYYQERLSMLPTVTGGSSTQAHLPTSTSPTGEKQIAILPDDHPTAAQVKIGPLGQITRPNQSGGASKKKSKGKDSTASSGLVPSAAPMSKPTLSGSLSVVESSQKLMGPLLGTGEW